jgi:hypothetical protein
MLNKESLKKYIEELIKEVEEELDESTTTGAIAGYDTPAAFSDDSDATKRRKKKIATQLGMQLVGKVESVNEALTSKEKRIKDGNPDNVFYAFYKGQFEAMYWAMNPSDLFNIYWDAFKVRRPAGSKFKLNPEFIIVSKKEYDRNPNHYSKLKPHVDKLWDKLQTESVNEAIKIQGKPEHWPGDDHTILVTTAPTKTYVLKFNNKNDSSPNSIRFPNSMGTKPVDTNKAAREFWLKIKADVVKWRSTNESVNEGKSKRPVNRWLELKNDESMHANKKLAVGLKELKYQLKEVETFFRWYNQIKTMNELDSNQYWKRTNSHIYKIKERIINIAKTLQEIEK